MKPQAVVLLSSGLDSLTALSQAVKEYHISLALTFDYGQRAAKQELACARKIARFYKIPHKTIKLTWLKKITTTALVNKKAQLPQLTAVSQGNKATAQAVWVPNRNGVFLNIAAAFAESLKSKILITGFNKEEAATFPDNSLAFCQKAEAFFSYSTSNKVKIKNYFYNKDKKEILKTAVKNQAPLEYLWSCYEGKAIFCGKCESCLRFKHAIIANKLTDLLNKHKKFRNIRSS